MAQARATKPDSPVLIIGAGINGCGVFRDLSLQGIDCLLIDRGDICEGASAASSRLIHGGIKYLETGEFRLVHESAIERNRLLRNAPHYVTPIETMLPLRSWFGGMLPSVLRLLGIQTKMKDRGALITEAGLRVYDAYYRKVRALPDHRFLKRTELRSAYPELYPGMIAAGLCSEGHITHADRLGLELVVDGLSANSGSDLSTYTTVRAGADGRLQLTDVLSGETRELATEVVINAGGAWIDAVNAALGIMSRHMGGSKGSHLIVENTALHDALKGRMIYFGTADGRVNLLYPYFGNVLTGSTHIAIADPDSATCIRAEMDYMLASVAEIFPTVKLTRAQVLLIYCGVRPLPRSAGSNIGTVSRDHSIAQDALSGRNTPALSLIGGKWPAFRAFAEQAADRVLEMRGKTRKITTEDLAIGGGRGFPVDAEAQRQLALSHADTCGLASLRAEALLSRYGTYVERVAAFISLAPENPLATPPGYTRRELPLLCRNEHVRRLSDLLFRRTSIAMEGLLTSAAIAESAIIAAEALSWDDTRCTTETQDCRSELNRHLPLALAA